MTVRVPLTGQYANHAFALVDDCDAGLALSRKWSLCGGYIVGTPRGEESAPLHRQILGLTRFDSRIVHHVNENPLDNRRVNLEVCASRSEANSRPHPLRDASCSCYQTSRLNDQRLADLVAALEEIAA